MTLASASPQRRAILEQVGIPFEARSTGVEELAAGDPEQVAAENARRKALALRVAPVRPGGQLGGRGEDARAPGPAGAPPSVRPHALVLGADTDVALDGDILGKPADAGQARAFLERLSGRTHRVVGAIALAEDGRLVAEAVEVTAVRFRTLDAATLAWYVDTGEWRGRAGGYAIQGRGAALVAAIDGDYLNVVGLPLARLLDLRPELLPGALQTPA